MTIPTIGIGAGAGCDGQVLVIHDLLGMYPGHVAKFVKQYGQVTQSVETAVSQYVREVKAGAFPEDRHSYHMAGEELQQLYGGDR